MKSTRRAAQASLLALGLLGTAASSVAAESKPREPQQIFENTCARCHTGDKAIGPPITMKFPESVHKARGDYMRKIVRNGRAAMPAFRHAEISDAELDALLKSLMSGQFAPATTEK